MKSNKADHAALILMTIESGAGRHLATRFEEHASKGSRKDLITHGERREFHQPGDQMKNTSSRVAVMPMQPTTTTHRHKRTPNQRTDCGSVSNG
ncbi:MAG: hypothetical protein ACREIA_08880 [Opitutaceae bacterium]